VTRDWRDERIEQLERENAELRKRIERLEERLRQSSHNSSKPPSSDGPSATPPKFRRRNKKPSGRKPGGQPGHQKFSRALVPPEEVDEHHDCVPGRCEFCGTRLHGRDPQPHLHQVFHLPEVRPVVHQYAQHALACPKCDHVTRGPLPVGVPRGAFGSSVVANVALLGGAYRMSKRLVQSVLADLFHLDISLGAVVDCQNTASAALEQPMVEAVEHVQQATYKHADETGWHDREGRAWLWVAVTSLVTVFMIHRRRTTQAAQQLLGPAKGCLVSDRHGGYSWWPLWARQLCWAHLIRDFTAISERPGHAGELGLKLLAEAERMFAWWHRVRDGTLSRKSFKIYMRGLQERVRLLLVEGRDKCANLPTARTCRKLLKVYPALWYFVDHEGVEPTNNTAEQTIRHAVLLRKLSHGTQSEAGSRFIERILSVHATLRQQGRHVLTFLQDACDAHLRGTRPPSLLPVASASPAYDHAA
jgi:transposase